MVAPIHVAVSCLLLMTGSLAVHTPADATIISGLQFGSITTFLKPTANVLHMEKDLFIPGNLLFSDGITLRSTNGKNNVIVAGNPNAAGYVEGSSANAQFSSITGFLQISKDLVLVVDQGNHCVRLVNRNSNSTSLYTGTCRTPGSNDGQYLATFNLPYSVIRHPTLPDKVIITDTGNNALRSLDLVTRQVDTIIKTGSDGPYHASVDKNLKDLYLTYGAYFGKVNLDTRNYTNITSQTRLGGHDDQLNRTSFTGARELLRYNQDILLIADRQSNLVRVVDLKESWVRSICTRGLNSAMLIDGPITNCSFYSPSSLLLDGNTLYIGENGAIRRVTVQSYEPDCVSKNKYVTLKANEIKAPVEVTPGVIIFYPIGQHYYEIPGRNCSVTVIVTPEKCPDPVYLVADSPTGTGAFSFEVGNQRNEIQLPVGKYKFLSKTDGLNCSMDVTIMSPTLKRRLDFKAIYNLGCKSVDNGDTIAMLKAVAKHRYDQIEDFCNGKCIIPAADGVSISCENDRTTVTWTTGTMYEANVFSVPKDILNSAYSEMAMRKRYLELVVYSQTPPVIYPNKNKDGFLAAVVLTPVCERGTYDQLSDSCNGR